MFPFHPDFGFLFDIDEYFSLASDGSLYLPSLRSFPVSTARREFSSRSSPSSRLTLSTLSGRQIRAQLLQAHARDGRPHGRTRQPRLPSIHRAHRQVLPRLPPIRSSRRRDVDSHGGSRIPFIQGRLDYESPGRAVQARLERGRGGRVHEERHQQCARESEVHYL